MAVEEKLHTITPYINYREPDRAIAFYKSAFGAIETTMHRDDEGNVVHAQISIGDSTVMISGVKPEFPLYRGAEDYGGSPVNLFLSVEDPRLFMDRAVAAGASVTEELREQPYGLSGGVKDPFGIVWWPTRLP